MKDLLKVIFGEGFDNGEKEVKEEVKNDDNQFNNFKTLEDWLEWLTSDAGVAIKTDSKINTEFDKEPKIVAGIKNGISGETGTLKVLDTALDVRTTLPDTNYINRICDCPNCISVSVEDEVKENVFVPSDEDYKDITYDGEDDKLDGFRSMMMEEFIPYRGFYNNKKNATVLMYVDGRVVKVKADKKNNNVNASNGVIIALVKALFHNNLTLSDVYNDLKTEPKAISYFTGLVQGFLISKGLFKNIKEFNKWLVNFVSELTIQG